MFVQDTFTDSDATALESHTGETGASWTKHPSESPSTSFEIQGNQLVENGAAGVYYASGDPASAEYDVQADFVTGVETSTRHASILGRIDTSARTWYMLNWDSFGTGDGWRLFRRVSGSYFSLGTYSTTLSDSSSYAAKLEIRDASKKAYIDEVERISSGDNTITAAGKSGVQFGRVNHDLKIDNFVATDPGGGGSSVISIDPGVYSLTGTDINTEHGRRIEITPGVYDLDGTDINLEQGHLIDITPGSYSTSGTDITTTKGYQTTIDAGTYSLTGTEINLEVGHQIEIDPGVYDYEGTNVSTLSGETVVIDPGTYSITGTDIDTRYNRVLEADPGTYTLVGTDINLEQGHQVTIDPGTYSIVGEDVDFNVGFTIVIESGEYNISSKETNFGATWVNNNTTGTHAWGNPGNVAADDSSFAFVSATMSLLDTNYLQGNNFGFNLPEDSTILGVSVEREILVSDDTSGTDYIRLVVDGVIVGDEKTGTTVVGVNEYGGSTDDWGNLLTREQINSNDFGLVYRAELAQSGLVTDLTIDYFTITVHYLDPVTLLVDRAISITPGVYTYTGTDVTLVAAGEAIEGGKFIAGQVYFPGFQQGEIYVLGFVQGQTNS